MMWLRYHRDRRLLRECHERRERALEKFDNLSYMNTIRNVVRRVLEDYTTDAEEIESVALLASEEIFARHASVPSRRQNLRDRIRRWAWLYANDYLRRRIVEVGA